MSNAPSFTSDGHHPLVCPLLQLMKEGQHNANATSASVTVVMVHGLVSCLGILENALILWVVGFGLRCRRTVASVWVLNLAMSDFLATLTLPLFTHYLHRSHSWDLPPALCSAQASIFFLNMFVSAFLLAAISIDRCLLVARPVWCQNRRSVAAAWKVCALGWLWAIANTFPYLLFRGVTTRRDGRNLCYHNFAYLSLPATLQRDCAVRHTATAISKMFLAFLMPLVVIAGSYVLFVLGLRRRARRTQTRRTQTSSPCRLLPDTPAIAKTDHDALSVTKTINASLKPPALRPARRALSSTSNSPFPASSSASAFNHSGQQQQQLSQSFTKMVTSVIAAFVLCWAPYHIFCLIEAAASVAVSAEDRRRKLYLVEVGLPIASTLAFLNSVLNPVLYAFCCPHFCVKIRQSLGAVFEGLLEEGGGGLVGRKLSVAGIGRKLDKGRAAAGSREVSSASQGCPGGSPRPPARNPSTLLLSTQRCLKAREMEMAERTEMNGGEGTT